MSVDVRNAGLAGAALTILLVAAPAVAQQSFADGPVQVVSEWTTLDRGDGSGAYSLVTSAAAGDFKVEHSLQATRSVRQDVAETELVRVLQGGRETARSGSDPSVLGAWGEVALTWTIPFDLGYDAAPRKTYRLNDKKVREIVTAVLPDARVTTRAGSDGRLAAQVEVPGVRPVDQLAAAFAAVRAAFDDAGVGIARLKIQGAAGPATAVASE